jgi:hypothetical protein
MAWLLVYFFIGMSHLIPYGLHNERTFRSHPSDPLISHSSHASKDVFCSSCRATFHRRTNPERDVGFARRKAGKGRKAEGPTENVGGQSAAGGRNREGKTAPVGERDSRVFITLFSLDIL